MPRIEIEVDEGDLRVVEEVAIEQKRSRKAQLEFIVEAYVDEKMRLKKQ